MLLNTETQDQHYPTPSNVADLMRSQFVQKFDCDSRIADFSAGNGVLLETFKLSCARPIRKGDWSVKHTVNKSLFACEIDPELRMVLREKGFTVLGTDFLQYWEPQKFDAVILNPPFNNGVNHFLHAWEFVKDGGEICCILNSETINNPYSKERQLLIQIIEDNGGYTKDLGSCFKDAERPTNVNVSMIYIRKPVRKLDFEFDASKFKHDSISDEEFASSPLEKTDRIKALVDRYKAAETALIKMCDAQKELNFYIKGIADSCDYDNEHRYAKIKPADELKGCHSQEELLNEIKGKFWNELFTTAKLGAKSTSDFKAKFQDFAVTQSSMSFTYENILEVLLMVVGNQSNIIQDALEAVFETGCKFDKENKVHWKGWESNSAYKWNKTKTIIPYSIKWDKMYGFSHYYGYDDRSGTNRTRTFLEDLDKVLCSITGDDYSEINSSAKAFSTHVDGLSYSNSKVHYEVSFSSWIDSEFIRLKIHKKGTLHIQFKDSKLLDEFNRRAANNKPWMPAKSEYTKSANRKTKSNKLAVIK